MTSATISVGNYAQHLAEHLQGPGISSPLGLWLLLALVAPQLDEEAQQELGRYLGSDAAHARAGALGLLADPHPAVSTAIGAWADDQRIRSLLAEILAEVPGAGVGAIPPQEELDTWAFTNTDGLVPSFPVQLSDDTALLLASALVARTAWFREMEVDDQGRLEAREGTFLICDTSAAGQVAVAIPEDRDQVSVISLIAAPGVAQGDVQRASYEIAQWLVNDRLAHHEVDPTELTDGHAWTVRDELELDWDSRVQWTSRLPAWDLNSDWDLTAAPGVGLVANHVAGMVPERRPMSFECRQLATGSYSETGFVAAAVTSIGITLGSAPPFEHVLVRHVEIAFDRPHAVLAVARGGAWEGMPVFQAWIDPADCANRAMGRRHE